MSITLTALEDRTAAVSLQLVPLFGFDHNPAWGTVSAALVALADRLDSRTPLVPLTEPYTLSHAWGSGPGPALPADTLRVYVGPSSGGREYGIGAAGGWSAGEPLPRPWGGFVGLDLDAIRRDGVDVATVARHEVLHVLGVGHTTDPAALMHPHLAPGVAKTMNHTDADLLASSGWRADTAGVLPGYTRVYGHGDTPNGWVMYPSDRVQQTFPSYVRVPDAGGWAFAPSYGVFTPA